MQGTCTKMISTE